MFLPLWYGGRNEPRKAKAVGTWTRRQAPVRRLSQQASKSEGRWHTAASAACSASEVATRLDKRRPLARNPMDIEDQTVRCNEPRKAKAVGTGLQFFANAPYGSQRASKGMAIDIADCLPI